MAKGSHADHVLVGRVRKLEENVYEFPEVGRLFHEHPKDARRHDAFSLKPGRWEFLKQRMLTTDAIVVDVAD